MKTAEEVKEWLEKQDWYDAFCRRVDTDKIFRTDARETILNGELLGQTITSAFNWARTEEGNEYWSNINLEFVEWYNKELENKPIQTDEDLIFGNGQTDHKNDRKDNKLPWELLPIEVIEEAVKVYQFGAEKYGKNTWQNLENGKERYYAALMRHLVAWRKGETKDEESQLHPLSHVIWNAIALLWLEMNNK